MLVQNPHILLRLSSMRKAEGEALQHKPWSIFPAAAFWREHCQDICRGVCRSGCSYKHIKLILRFSKKSKLNLSEPAAELAGELDCNCWGKEYLPLAQHPWAPAGFSCQLGIGSLISPPAFAHLRWASTSNAKKWCCAIFSLALLQKKEVVIWAKLRSNELQIWDNKAKNWESPWV